jgi:aryl-alcohol dehydrogenase-like predicted oxidoreductase
MHFTTRSLGRTGITVSPLGLATGMDALPPREVERAFERGIRYFYWGTRRGSAFGKGVRAIARHHRDEITTVVQTYTRAGSLMRGSLERALRKFGIEYTDVLLLGWWNQPPPARIFDAALALKERGLAKHLAISCHDRNVFAEYAKNPAYGAVMVRYNAVHPCAETEVFPLLGEPRPGVISYTATRWGHLLDPAALPADEPRPRASDCYRFVLTNPGVDIAMCAPNDAAGLDEALATIERGPMTDEELAWMKRVGVHVKRAMAGRRTFNPIEALDHVASTFAKRPPAGLDTRTD